MPSRDAQIQLVDTVDGVQDMVSEITNRDKKPLIFVDLEGVNLSRDGTIAIIQVLVPPSPTVYLIDVHTLQDKAFHSLTRDGYTWKAILEVGSYAKVFFDVRNDSDALYSHYGISIRGVIDVQLLEFATRPGHNRPRFLKGLSKCISESGILSWQEARTWEQAKDDGIRQFAPEKGGTYDVFLRRPLSSAMQIYCAEDVLRLPPLLVCYARRISRHLAGEVAKEALARVTLSQSPTYNPHGQQKAIGPTISWQSTARSPVLSFPMSLMFSPELKEYCLIKQAACKPAPAHPAPGLSETVTVAIPVPPGEVDKVTQLMENASIGAGSQADSLSYKEDEVPGHESIDQGKIFEAHLGTDNQAPEGVL